LFPLAKSQAPPSLISKSSWVMLSLLKIGDAFVPLVQAFLKDHQNHDAFLAYAS